MNEHVAYGWITEMEKIESNFISMGKIAAKKKKGGYGRAALQGAALAGGAALTWDANQVRMALNDFAREEGHPNFRSAIKAHPWSKVREVAKAIGLSPAWAVGALARAAAVPTALGAMVALGAKAVSNKRSGHTKKAEVVSDWLPSVYQNAYKVIKDE